MRRTSLLMAMVMMGLGLAACGDIDDPAAVSNPEQATREISKFALDDGVSPKEAEAVLAMLPGRAVGAAVAGGISKINGKYGVGLQFDSGVICGYRVDLLSQKCMVNGYVIEGQVLGPLAENSNTSLSASLHSKVNSIVMLNTK